MGGYLSYLQFTIVRNKIVINRIAVSIPVSISLLTYISTFLKKIPARMSGSQDRYVCSQLYYFTFLSKTHGQFQLPTTLLILDDFDFLKILSILVGL
jgi:hypothetical protein